MNFKKITFAIAIIGLSTMACANKGETIYKNHCAACHMTGVANAPKVHDVKAWQQRLDQIKADLQKADPALKGKALEAAMYKQLYATIRKGKGAMPATGMCPKCSDDDYKAAIDYMKSKK